MLRDWANIDLNDRVVLLGQGQSIEVWSKRNWDEYQKMPRRKFIGARTQGAVEAQYLDAWRQRIERVGTANFPEEARRQGLFGRVMVTVAVFEVPTVYAVSEERVS